MCILNVPILRIAWYTKPNISQNSSRVVLPNGGYMKNRGVTKFHTRNRFTFLSLNYVFHILFVNSVILASYSTALIYWFGPISHQDKTNAISLLHRQSPFHFGNYDRQRHYPLSRLFCYGFRMPDSLMAIGWNL